MVFIVVSPVCMKVLGEVDVKGKSMADARKELFKKCKGLDGVERRFCYYLGATEDAATSIIEQALKPMGFGKPVDKICEELNSKDSQICQLRFGTGHWMCA